MEDLIWAVILGAVAWGALNVAVVVEKRAGSSVVGFEAGIAAFLAAIAVIRA